MAENRARVYWKEHFVRKEKERVAIIGFDALGQELLCHGLMMNLYSLSQKIEYHIWGDSKCFKGLHSGLTEENIGMDKIVYHESDWEIDILKGQEFDRIIFCESAEEDLINLSRVISFVPCKTLHVYVDSKECLECIKNSTGGVTVESFGAIEDVARLDIILDETLLCDAKELNYRYVKSQQGDAEELSKTERGTPRTKKGIRKEEEREKARRDDAWGKLSPFHKRSNISATDYGAVLKELVKSRDLPQDELVEEMAELEHIRWNRFHYLNNWSHAPQRDNENKKHDCLVPYNELSEENKEKDRRNVRYFLEDNHRVKSEV
jgi:hypothetical protein